MSTTLAEQLQKLVVPQTSALNRDKVRPSLLFDKKQAAEISREVIYQIGLDGFEELKLKCSSFESFENTLFHVTSKQFERSVHDVVANERLDKQIKQFFLILCPYFTLNCAHKALEWLINRFSVHEYNRNDFLMLILPYHETNIFVRALQLVKISDSGDNFLWLKNVQRNGIHLPKSLLYAHAAQSAHFLKDIGDFLLQALKDQTQPHAINILLNFYCATVTGGLEYANHISETHISQILNVLSKGHKSSLADFCAGSYIITAKLLSKVELSEKILNKFVNNITLMPVNQLQEEAILLLVVLYQTQKHFLKMSYCAVKNLASKIETVRILGKLHSTRNSINSLLEPLLKGFIEYGLLQVESKEMHTFLVTLLNDVKLEEQVVSKLISFILETYDLQRKNLTDDAYKWITNIMLIIETQYPILFDREANEVMKVQPGEKFTRKQKCFQKLIINCSNTQTNTGMFNKMYHPISGIRKEIVKRYIKSYKDLEDKDQQYLKAMILQKLIDENQDVVLGILSQSKKLLPEIIDHSTLKNVLILLLKKCLTNQWKNVSCISLEILCSISDEDDIAVFCAILPYLLPLEESDLKIAMVIVDSGYLTNSKFWQKLNVDRLKGVTHNVFFDTIISNLQSIEGDLIKIIDIVENNLAKDECILSKYIIIMFLCKLLPENVSVDITSRVLNILTVSINQTNLIAEGKCSLWSYIMLARKNKLSLKGILDFIVVLVEKTDFSLYNLELVDLTRPSKENTFLIVVLDMLLTGCYTSKGAGAELYAKTFKNVLSSFFQNPQSQIEFLFNVCITDREDIDPSLRLRSLRTIYALIKGKFRGTSINEIITSYLLISLSNENEDFRMLVINTITIIIKNMNSNSEGDYLRFLKNILNYKDELVLDHRQISTVVTNVLMKAGQDKDIQAVVTKLVGLVSNKKFPLYLRECLVNILISTDSFEIYNQLLELGVELLQQNKDSNINLNKQTSITLFNMLTSLDAENAHKLLISSNIFKTLDIGIHSDALTIVYPNINISASVLSINHIQTLFEHLTYDVQSAILNSVVEIAANTLNSDVVAAARKLFKHIDLDATQIIQQISEMYDILQPEFNVAKRKRRISQVPTVDVLETLQWKKGIVIFEFLQDKKKIRNSESFIALLFKILKKCLDFDEQSNIEYPKQLILSTLLNCCTKLEDRNVSDNIFNVEVLVQCIRASHNPQTHYHALLVLTYAANFVPKQVLHHMMAIFTFMGSSVLRHDDAYSFQIINKIIETIIPILVEDNSLNNTVTVLRVFVDAILDVPEHRRVTLYHNLIEKIGPEDNLHLFILLMLEAYVLHANVEKQKSKNANVKSTIAPKRLDVAADISRKFSPEILIRCCIKIIMFLQKLPELKEDIINISLPFDITHQTPKQYRHFKYTIVTFVTNLLSSPEFVCVIANLSDENQQKLETIYKDMIINTVTYIQSIAKIADKNRNTSQGHYWKTILHHSYDVLDSINALLTPHMFLLVIRGLTTHSLNHIRRRSLELLNTKLQHDLEFFSNCTKSEIYEVIPALLNIIRQEQSDESQLTVQTAFLSLKLLIRFFAHDNLDKFVNVLNYLSDLIKSTKIQGNILASAVLCLSELCCHLRAHAIPNLSNFMPSLVKLLKIHRQQNYPDLLLLSAITAILKILESLPLFLSQYLEKLLHEVCLMCSKWNDPDDNKLQAIITKLLIMKEKVAELVPFRVLLPAITKTYHHLVQEKNYSSIIALMDILSRKLSRLSSFEMQSNISDLTTFFLHAFNFRADRLTEFVQTNAIEKHIINTANIFILKLSESAFRPLYYKIYDWAVRHDVKNERVITFYALSSTIAEHLKSLFVLFAGHILNNAALLLNLCNITRQQQTYYEDEEKTILLLELVLKTLHNIFLYDTRKFVNKERFILLMQPIVDQLENNLGTEITFISRTENLVIPCIVQFAMATGDDSLWKQLNYEVLLKMRHSSSTIRILALKCVLQLAIKLASDFLPLLPEVIPFLAELLEDENQDVEQTCQKTVQELEKILGEPLQKYF